MDNKIKVEISWSKKDNRLGKRFINPKNVKYILEKFLEGWDLKIKVEEIID